MDLSTDVKVTEDQEREVEVSLTSSLSTSHPVKRRAKCQLSCNQEGDLAEEVKQRVAKSMRHLPFITEATMDDDGTLGEDRPRAPSGFRCMGASMVVKKMMWPHEVVYSNKGKPAVYESYPSPCL